MASNDNKERRFREAAEACPYCRKAVIEYRNAVLENGQLHAEVEREARNADSLREQARLLGEERDAARADLREARALLRSVPEQRDSSYPIHGDEYEERRAALLAKHEEAGDA